MTLKRAEWVKLVEQWRASGQSARQFAKAHGVVDTALRYWANRLDEEEDEREARPPRRTGGRASARTSSAPALARVVRPGETPTAQAGRITVVIGKATIVVEPGFADAHLRDVVRALSEVG